MPEKKFLLKCHVSSDNPAVVKTILEQEIGKNGSVKQTSEGFEVTAELKGTSSRDLNRTLLSAMRRVEKKTRLRAEWTCDGTTEKFFDYGLKGTKKA
jgi:hypothetical protein